MRSATWLRMFKTVTRPPFQARNRPSGEQLPAKCHADGDGSTSERNCEHRRIASQNITIAAIRILDSRQLDRLQDVLDHIAYDKEYYMPERGCGMHR